MKHLIIKVTGVTPKELSALHALYEDGQTQFSESPIDWQLGDTYHRSGSGGSCRAILAQIMSSKLDKEHGTYTVEIRVDATIGNVWPPKEFQRPDNKWEFRASAEVVSRIWDALRIFPLKEEFVKVRD